MIPKSGNWFPEKIMHQEINNEARMQHSCNGAGQRMIPKSGGRFSEKIMRQEINSEAPMQHSCIGAE